MHAAAIGTLSKTQLANLQLAAERSGATLEVHASVDDAKKEIKDAASVDCLLAAPDASTRRLTDWARSREGWFNLPILALVAHPTDADFQRAFVDGADDAVPIDNVAAVQRRFANIHRHNPAARPPANQGVALIASSDIAERRNLGRVLRQAGFDVAFASEARELMALSSTGRAPTLVVATPSFPPLGGDAAVRTVRTTTHNPELPAIVLKPTAEAGQGELSVHGSGDVRGELLFFAEEALRSGPAKDLRTSARLHFASVCAFRGAGLLEPTYGLTHNVSEAGLFVRTLDPPKVGDELWLELRTFQGDTVHLRGTVAWSRGLSEVGGTAPPGFGVKLDAVRCPPYDLASYTRAYHALAQYQAREVN